LALRVFSRARNNKIAFRIKADIKRQAGSAGSVANRTLQIGAQLLAFAPFLKSTPISLKEAKDAPRRSGRLCETRSADGRAHYSTSFFTK
jgi:hypothetical protein